MSASSAYPFCRTDCCWNASSLDRGQVLDKFWTPMDFIKPQSVKGRMPAGRIPMERQPSSSIDGCPKLAVFATDSRVSLLLPKGQLMVLES